MKETERKKLKNKKRIVIKIGSSTITHPETGKINLGKIEHLVREISDLKGMGKEVILVSSGAIATGRQALGFKNKPKKLSEKQALAAVGQARLMMVYQRLFSEYNMNTAQVLLTKSTMRDREARENVVNTFDELLKLGTVPVVNENDTISTYEIRFGDNDRLSALVAALVGADLLILLSDIDGFYSDDPKRNPGAEFIPTVKKLTGRLFEMGKSTSGSDLGSGGMHTKLEAARIVCSVGADMIVASGDHMEIIGELLAGEEKGTLFVAGRDPSFDFSRFLEDND